MENKSENLIDKTPTIVVLGHVDHGKTSILDYIRKTSLAEKEEGSITQHIGAYQIKRNNKKITFLDTPGHEAFLTLRARGARVADIGLLVIDATEGIKPQTKEAISHLKSFNIPFIVVLNKIDKSNANPEKVKRELMKENVFLEGMGGDIPWVEVSAKTGKGINELLELIELVAEIKKIKADIKKKARGVIIEAFLDPKRGPTATLILEEGILKRREIIGTSSTFGKIRIMEDSQGKPIEKIFPGDPAVVIGFERVPLVGESFQTFDDIESAKSQIKIEKEKKIAFKVSSLSSPQRVLKLILKTDVWGSLEAIEQTLKKIQPEKIALEILKGEIGDVNESDVKLAKNTQAIILGFRVKITPVVKKIIEREKIKVKNFKVIYDLVEGIYKLIKEAQEPEIKRIELGKVKTLVIFLTEKNRQIIGGKVIEGKVKKGAKIEVFRNNELVGKGRLVNLKKGQKDISEIQAPQECGILFEGDIKIEVGDILKIIFLEKR